MALDIIIDSDSNGQSIVLFIEDYDAIMEKIEGVNGFDLIKEKLSDYYGESDVYLNELTELKLEVSLLKQHFHDSLPETVGAFLVAFLTLIDYAIKNNKTIKFIGD